MFGFAKYLQASFSNLQTTVFVFFALAVFFVFVSNLFQQQIHQLSDPLFQRLFLWLFQQFSCNILYIVFEYFTNCHEGVTDHTRPFVFISITSGVFVKKSCPLARMIHDCIFIPTKKLYFFSIIKLIAMSVSLRFRILFLPSVTQTLIAFILLLLTGCHSSRSGSFRNG